MATTDLEKQPLLVVGPSTTESEQPEQEQSLSELQNAVFKAQREYMRAWSRTTSGQWHKRVMMGVTALLMLFVIFSLSIIIAEGLSEDDYVPPRRVPLEAHIMSKCPDARDCLRDMILPAMQNVSHKVDFQLSYIGTVTHEDDGVLCKHGQEECLGNIIELCATRLYPNPKIHLGFAMCMSKDYQDIPKKELIEECALEHGISFEKLNDCAVAEDGSLSIEMLRKSFERSQDAGVTKSCTVRVDGDVFCIRDDGQWKECENGSTAGDLVAEIEKRYQAQDLQYSEGW